MFDDDNNDRSSQAPSQGKALTIPAAVLWLLLATVGTMALLLTVHAMHPAAERDLVTGVASQAAAYLACVFMMLRVHAPQRKLSDALGLRSTHGLFYVIALCAGLPLQIVAELVQRGVERVWPTPPDVLREQLEMLRLDSPLRWVMIPFVVAVVGPVVEELLFRGAMQGGLRRVHRNWTVVLVVSALFAAAHGRLQVVLPTFLVGLMVSTLRAASGSVVPAMLAHMAFNGVAMVGVATGAVTNEPQPEPLALWLVVGGVTTTSLLVAAALVLAKRSTRAQRARQEDLA